MTVAASADDLTPSWLTRVLNEAGFNGAVQDVTWHSIGAGQIGENARFTLAVEGDLPTSLVGKFPSTDPVSRQTGTELQNYAREVFFYTQLDATVDIQTPSIYATEFDPANHDFVVLMEDLAPGTQIDQMDACSPDQAALALEQLAKLHGPRWGDTSLTQHPLLVREPPVPGEPSIYELVQTPYFQRYGERVSAAQHQATERFGRLQTQYLQSDGAQTLIHIDYRSDNMIFGGPYPLTVLDWQSISLGCALNDVSYFMGTSLEPEVRAAEERALLSLYLDELNRYDVGLSFDDAWSLYRRYAPAGLHMAVVASMIVGETPRGNDMFMAMMRRSVAMCEDLETFSLLESG